MANIIERLDKLEYKVTQIEAMTYHDAHSARTWIEDEVLEDLRSANSRLVKRNVELKKQVHQYQCELALGQPSVAYLELVKKENADLKQEIKNIHTYQYGGRLTEARLEIDRLNTENLRLKQVQRQQARIIRNLRASQPCGLHRYACPNCGG